MEGIDRDPLSPDPEAPECALEPTAEASERITKLAFAKSLERARSRQGFSQKQVAISVAVGASTYSRWESAEDSLLPSFEKLRDLAVTLKVSVDSLMGIAPPSLQGALDPAEEALVAAFRLLPLDDRAAVLHLMKRRRPRF